MEQRVCFWSESVRVGEAEYVLTVATSWEGLCWCNLGEREQNETELTTWVKRYLAGVRLTRSQKENHEALKQVGEYLQGERTNFTLPLHQVGTSFQKRVWNALLQIPYGMTSSYQETAAKAECPKGSRAVGLANSKNPIAIVVPCHRVIGKDGSLTGYAGGLDLKRRLLEIEGLSHLESERKER